MGEGSAVRALYNPGQDCTKATILFRGTWALFCFLPSGQDYNLIILYLVQEPVDSVHKHYFNSKYINCCCSFSTQIVQCWCEEIVR